MRKFALLFLVAVFSGWSSGAWAIPVVVKNLATGINDLTGNKVGYGSPDPDYQIYEGTVQGSGSPPVTYAGPSESGGWIEDGASSESRWISTAGSNNATPLTTFFFQTTFVLSEADWNSARIEGFRFAADNQLIDLSINGTSVFSAVPVSTGAFDYESFQNLGTIGSGLFEEGSNTILFAVYNGQHEPGTYRLNGGASSIGEVFEDAQTAGESYFRISLTLTTVPAPEPVPAMSTLGQLVIVFMLGAVTALYLNRRRQSAGV